MLKLPLRDVFVKREKRFVLLDAGCERAAFRADSKLLEVGCAGGEAAAHMAELGYSKLTAVDIDADIIAEARKKAPDCDFACADACALPFESGSFDGIYSEASFALISDKSMAAEEYFRVLKKGGRVLLNEFALRIRTDSRRRSVEGIPMLMGVQTMERYREMFEAQGLICVYEKEEFPELVRIAMSLGKAYGIPPAEVGGYIAASFGGDSFVDDFFSQTQMSYCQMIFEKA